MRFQIEMRTLLGNDERHSCLILTKNLSTFCPCPETLWESEFKGDGLSNLVKKISRQSSIQILDGYC
jgi:hypothetical protein